MDDFKPQKPDQPGRPDEGAELQQQTYQGEQSTYDATPEPVRSDETVAAPVASTKKKSSAKKWLFGGLAALLLAAASALAYWQWADAQNARSEVASLRASLEAAQKQNQEDGAETPAAQPERVITTMELAETYADAYKGSGSSLKFFTRVEKTDGDAALLYTKAETPNAEPVNFVLKRVGDTVVTVDSYGASMTKMQAEFLKTIYGIDAAKLGIEVSDQ